MNQTCPWSIVQQTAFMRLALVEATNAMEQGDLPIGAVVVNDDTVIARGRNRRETEHFLSHAEVDAIRSMPAASVSRRRTAIFCTLEPCYLCLGAILAARIGHIFFAAPDLLSGCRQIASLGSYSRTRVLTITAGLLARESVSLLYRHSPERCKVLFQENFNDYRRLLADEPGIRDRQ